MEETFEVGKELGRGGQAVVHMVERRSDGKLFACKSYSVFRFFEPFDDGLGRRPCSEVEAEIKVMERLSLCDENIVKVLEVFREEDQYHFIMELGLYSLHHRIYAKKVFGEDEAAVVMRSLGRQVSEMHKLGIVHRDIKPGNVLVAPGERDGVVYKLADFGLASFFTVSGVLTEEAGTKRYMAPEMLRGSYDERVDEWGLGLMLYEMVTGKISFQKFTSDEVARRLRRLEDLPVDLLDLSTVSEEARSLILHLLSLQPEKRLLAADIEQHPWVVKNSNPKGKQDMELKTLTARRPVAKRTWYVHQGQQAEGARKRICT